jgi:hypothetical protein
MSRSECFSFKNVNFLGPTWQGMHTLSLFIVCGHIWCSLSICKGISKLTKPCDGPSNTQASLNEQMKITVK